MDHLPNRWKKGAGLSVPSTTAAMRFFIHNLEKHVSSNKMDTKFNIIILW